MTELVMLSGPKNFPPSENMEEFSLDEIADWYKSLSDQDAGAMLIQTIGERFPLLTWNDFSKENFPLTRQLMFEEMEKDGIALGAKCKGLECLGSWASDSVDMIGRHGGDLIRLLTDEEVAGTLLEAGTAYFTGGQSLALDGVMKGIGGDGKEKVVQIQQAGFISGMSPGDKKTLIYAGAGFAGLITLVMVVSLVKK